MKDANEEIGGQKKGLYRKTRVDCLDHVVEVVKKSSPAGLNKAQCYEGGKGFQLVFHVTIQKRKVKVVTIAFATTFYMSQISL